MTEQLNWTEYFYLLEYIKLQFNYITAIYIWYDYFMPGDFIYTHCLHFHILYLSLNLFHRDCSCCSSHVWQIWCFFFFIIELFSSNSTIHYYHHHSFLKQSPLSMFSRLHSVLPAESSQSPFLFYLLYKVSECWSASKSTHTFFSFVSRSYHLLNKNLWSE